MFSISRNMVFVFCLLAGTIGYAEEVGTRAEPQELADYITSIRDSEPAPYEVAQGNGDEVLEFDFREMGKDNGPPDLLDSEVFNRRVTLDFKNADVQNVIRLIAARTGLNILLDPSEVTGRITLSLNDVPLGDALDNILKVNKLAYIVESGGILRVVPESRVGRTQVETQTEIIELNWRDATDIASTFEPFLTPHGNIRANAQAQVIIITDTPPNIIRIKALIAQIDRPDRQVVIAARLVDINLTQGRTLATEWGLTKRNKVFDRRFNATDGELLGIDLDMIGAGTDLTSILGLNPVLLEGASVSGGLGTFQFGSTLGIFGDEYDLDARLSFLELSDIVEILANPRVTTLNNVPAQIRIVERIPYIEAVQGPSSGTTIAEVEFEEAGVIIDVKPTITPNRFVRLEVDLEQRIFRRRIAASSDAAAIAFNPPQIDVRTARSTVIVRDTHTVVLGGLRQIRNGEIVEGVPWLRKIPVIGWMFKNKANDHQKTELVLMVTPTIVEEAGLNEVEYDLYQRIDDVWDYPDYFSDDMSEAANPYPYKSQR